MKKLFTAFFAISTLFVAAQSQLGINYQSIIRNSSGTVLASTPVTVEFKLYSTLTFTNILLYHETHSTTTNQFGMANLVIGQGTVVGGIVTFSNVPWPAGVAYEVIVNSNQVGTRMPFVSVPYALAAAYAPAPSVTYSNSILSVGGNTVTISSGGSFNAGQGIDITGATITGTANIIGTGATTVTGTYPNLTINTPTVAPDQVVTISAAGAATVSGTYPNYTVNVPNGANLPSAYSGQLLYYNGVVWDTIPQSNLFFDAANSRVGIGTQNPAYDLHVDGTGSFNSSMQTPHVITNTITVSGGTFGQVLTSDATGNGTFQNLPSPSLSYNNATNELTLSQGSTVTTATLIGTGTNTTSIVGSGLVTVTPTTGSTFTVNVPAPTYVAASGLLGFGGTNTVSITQPLSLSGSTLTSGIATNSVNLSSINNWSVASGVTFPSTLTNSVAIGVSSGISSKFEILHTATQANPTMHLRETTGNLSRIKYSNSTVANKFFETAAQTNATDAYGAYSINYYDGTNYSPVFLVTGEKKVSVNNLNTVLSSLHVMEGTGTAGGGIISEGFARAAQISLFRNNQPSLTRTQVVSGDELGRINFAGHDGASYGDGARIYAKASENNTSTSKGTELVFSSVPNGSSSAIDVFKINSASNLQVMTGLYIPLLAGSGKVLTSDATGNASWQTPAVPSAPWTQNTGIVNLTTSTDKVGIGTATPASKLEVVTDGTLIGGVRITNTLSTSVGPGLYFKGQSKDWTITGTNAGSGSGANKFVIRDYSNASDRFVITSSGEVGIGIINPAETLDVAGGVQILGGSDYRYASAQTRYLSIPVNSLKSINSAYDVTTASYVAGADGDAGYAYITNGTIGSTAVATSPVYLPDGAVVTGVLVRYFDSDATYNGTFSLERRSHSSIVSDQLATYTSSGSSSFNNAAATQNITAITNATIDNLNYSYYIKFKTTQNNTSIGVLDFRIQYTVLKAD